MVTIYDIARKAGVSPATVSKALNGRPDVNDVTRSHIIAAAAELGYTPNVHARGLKLKKSWLIGVVYSDDGVSLPLDHPLFLPLLDSFKREIEADGYELLFFSDNSPLVGNNMIAHCCSRQVDGVLLVNVDNVDAPAVSSAANDIPMVSCNLVLDGVPAVITDNFSAASKAVEYLYSLGHRRIAHVAGPMQTHVLAASERLAGYKAALEACGLAYDPSLVVVADAWTPEAGAEAFSRLLVGKDSSLTAVFFASDSLMMGALPLMKEHNLFSPDDLSVIGFDGAQWTQFLGGGYTTFRQQAGLLGSTSARLLLEKIDGASRADIVRIPAELVIRNSCAMIGGNA
jgi:DNA-binding LacI/PurR family transcriptional regulator